MKSKRIKRRKPQPLALGFNLTVELVSSQSGPHRAISREVIDKTFELGYLSVDPQQLKSPKRMPQAIKWGGVTIRRARKRARR